MNAGQVAALIAAVFFAALACVGMFVLLRLARLMSAATGMITDYRVKTDHLIEQAQAAVDRTNEQLARTDAITASMDQVTANMAELSGHVSVLAGLARSISAAATAPLTGASAFVFGLRRATAVRRSLQVAAETVAETPACAAITGPAARTGRLTVRSGRPPAGSRGGAAARVVGRR
jgi:uncharacterized protein YoxC